MKKFILTIVLCFFANMVCFSVVVIGLGDHRQIGNADLGDEGGFQIRRDSLDQFLGQVVKEIGFVHNPSIRAEIIRNLLTDSAPL